MDYFDIIFSQWEKKIKLEKNKNSLDLTEISYEKIIGYELLENNKIVTSTSKRGVVVRSIIGGMIGGVAGSIIGGTTAGSSSTSSSVVSSYKLVIYLSDGRNYSIDLLQNGRIKYIDAKGKGLRLSRYLDEIIAQNEEETCKKNQIVDNNQKQIKEKNTIPVVLRPQNGGKITCPHCKASQYPTTRCICLKCGKSYKLVDEDVYNEIVEEEKRFNQEKEETSSDVEVITKSTNISPIEMAKAIREMKELLDAGIITSEEFTLYKTKLFSSL